MPSIQRPHCRRPWLTSVAALLLVATAWPQSTQARGRKATRAKARTWVVLAEGADKKERIPEGRRGRKKNYYQLRRGKPFVVSARGPVVLVLHFRALAFGESSGTLEILDPKTKLVSANEYQLTRDWKNNTRTSGLSEKSTYHFKVPKGEHLYEIRSRFGPDLVVRLAKTSRFRAKLATAPLKTPESYYPPEVLNPPQAKDASVTDGSGAAAQAVAAEHTDAESGDPLEVLDEDDDAEEEVLLVGETSDADAEPPPLSARPLRNRGLAIALRTGAMTLTGQPSEPGLMNRVGIPVHLEFASNLDDRFSVYAEPAFFMGRVNVSLPDGVDGSELGANPLRASLTTFTLGIGGSAALRLGDATTLSARAGGTIGRVSSTVTVLGDTQVELAPSTGIGVGVIVGAAAEFQVGPGRFGLEARWQVLGSWMGTLAGRSFTQSLGSGLSGPQLLIGYRWEPSSR